MLRPLVAAFAVCLAALVVPVTDLPASAASGAAAYTKTATRLFSCQDSRCPDLRGVPAHTALSAYCWRDGNSYAGSGRWFRVSSDGIRGWVTTGAIRLPQPRLPYCSDLLPGEELFTGESVWSPNGGYHLIMQGDGNLVIYGPAGPIWASNTGGMRGLFATMQTDGNFVIYDTSYRPIFATGTTGYLGASMVMQSDSNLVEYGPGALWASNWHVYSGQPTVSRNAGYLGNCTWYALERWKGFWLRHAYPALSGNAYQWAASARSLGYNVQTQPATQSMVVFAPGVAGSNPRYGHVAWVDDVTPRPDGSYIHVWEMNWNGFNKIDNRWVKVVDGLSFITAPAI